MNSLLIFGLLAISALAVAEPPSSYLPPQSRNSLSRQYGAPQQSSNGIGRSASRSSSYNSIAENQFGGSSRSNNRQRSAFQRQQPAQQYEPQSNVFDNSVGSARSGAPRGFGSASDRQQPTSQYNAPSNRFQQPTSSYAAAARQQPSSQYGAPSPVYGAPFGKNAAAEDDLAEPANYEYNYEVSAADESGAEFGHQETREEGTARGEYHVLLPDGRRQIVEYEADDEGFRSKIRYEDVGYPDARDNAGPY